jgi:mRNA-degrading endonuclease RelE of RelBE toxin-antitoxin system
VAIEECLPMRETAEILGDPAALRSLAAAMESERRATWCTASRAPGLSGFHGARLGIQCRVICRIDESKHAVLVEDIQHRSTAYRRR